MCVVARPVFSRPLEKRRDCVLTTDQWAVQREPAVQEAAGGEEPVACGGKDGCHVAGCVGAVPEPRSIYILKEKSAQKEISLAGVNGKSQPFQDFVQQDDPG